jgi:pimeloyl-ACP methyl ester carboxylesterase
MDKKTFEEIKKDCIETVRHTLDAQHSIDHLVRVESNALRIVQYLNYANKIDLNLLRSICYLHDMAYIKHKPGLITYFFEGSLAVGVLREYLNKYDLTNKEKNIILTAVKNHPLAFPFRKLNKNKDIYSKILQDADQLDYFHLIRVSGRMAGIIGFQKYFDQSDLLQNLSKKISVWGMRHQGSFVNYPELVFRFLANNDKDYSFIESEGKGPRTMILLHGYADSAKLFSKLIKLIENKYKVYSLDLPMSIGGSTGIYNIDDLTQYVIAFADSLGLEKYDLTGFSLGGVIATGVAGKDYRVERLFLLNSSPTIVLSIINRNFLRIFSPILKFRLFLYLYSRINANPMFRKKIGMFLLDEDTIERMKKNYLSIFGTVINIASNSLEKEFNKLEIPKTVLLFKDDEVIKYKKYLSYINKLSCEIITFEEGGHASKPLYWDNVANYLNNYSK